MRAVRLTLLAAVVALAALPASASAITFSSSLTSPSDGGTVMFLERAAQTAESVTFAGSTNSPSSTVDIGCFINGVRDKLIAAGVATDGSGNFSTTLATSAFVQSLSGYGLCDVRAVQPGQLALTAGELGPRLTFGEDAESVNGGKLFDFYAHVPATAAVTFDLESFSHYGLDDSYHYNRESLANENLFYGNGVAQGGNLAGDAASLVIDGHNAVAPYRAKVYNAASAGREALSYDLQVNRATRQSVLESQEPLVRCNTDTLPVNATNCSDFSPSGVRLDRRIEVGPITGAGFDITAAQVLMIDTWRSTDGAAHTVDMQLEEDFRNATGNVFGVFTLWIGTPSAPLPTISPIPGADSLDVPAGDVPRSWITQRDTSTPASDVNPYGVTALYPAPTKLKWKVEPYFFNTVESLSVPAVGATVRRRVYASAGTLAMAKLAQAFAEDRAAVPVIENFAVRTGSASAAQAPATTASSVVTVTGKVVDPGGKDTLTVAGLATAIGADGSFTASVPVKLGSNAIQAVATDGAGQTAEAAVLVKRTAPKVALTKPAKGVIVAKAGASSLTVSLSSPGKVAVKVTAKSGKKTVLVAQGKATVKAPGKVKVRIKLTKAGKVLVKKAGRKGLPVVVTTTGTTTGAKAVIVKNKLRLRG